MQLLILFATGMASHLGFPPPPDFGGTHQESDDVRPVFLSRLFNLPQSNQAAEATDVAGGSSSFVEVLPTSSIAASLGNGWWMEGPSRHRPKGFIRLGLEKTPWKAEAWDDPPIVLRLNSPGHMKAPIMLSFEVAVTKLDIPFKFGKIKMDDVHLWMKVGTGFTDDDRWLRIEFARPPPENEMYKTEGFNWYVTKAEPIIGDFTQAEAIRYSSLFDILNAIADVGIPTAREDGRDPYSILPGWLPKQYWNCYTALNEVNDRLGIHGNLGHPWLYHFVQVLTLGSVSGRRRGDDVLTDKARAIKMTAAERPHKIKYSRECGFSGLCFAFGQHEPEEEKVGKTLNQAHFHTPLIIFSCILFYILTHFFHQYKSRKDNLYRKILLAEDI